MTHRLKKGGRRGLQGLAEELADRPKSELPLNRSQTPLKDFSSEILKRQTVRRKDLRRLVPLSDTTIYELEQKGQFPKRFYLTPRCAVWPLEEVLAWVDERRAACETGMADRAPHPDYRLRSANG